MLMCTEYLTELAQPHLRNPRSNQTAVTSRTRKGMQAATATLGKSHLHKYRLHHLVVDTKRVSELSHENSGYLLYIFSEKLNSDFSLMQ